MSTVPGWKHRRILPWMALVGAALPASTAHAQGCILARQTSPVLSEDPYLLRSEWQVSATYRALRSDTHFMGTEEDPRRPRLRNNVVNKQQLLDIGVTHAVSRRLNVTLGIPILVYGGWSVPVPVAPPGARQVQSASGLGDISLTGRYWLLEPDTHLKGNVALGLGIKAPTGNSNAKDRFPDANGQNFAVMPVDQSIQPGDGGWGINLDLQAFKRVGSATLFASGTYLVNPRETNDTESSVLFLCGGTIPDNLQQFKYNSVPDQYLARVGVIAPVPKVQGLSVSLATRIEGVPQADLIGGNDGFRRPGYSIFVEPGLSYSTGSHTFTLNVPVATQRNLQKLGTYQVDGTLADYIILAGYSYRFGAHRRPAGKASPGMSKPHSLFPPPTQPK
ncbi:MAG: hypothetical protein K0Q72_885 [Armatimonadetes bacterium]|jgi:hypothetical protein|nr:hypothetical protein [Armatimonadota bacterium]